MKIKAPKVSEIIAEKLEGMILDGSYHCGEKLPSERALAQEFDVSRPSLREAIQMLEAKGLISRRQGGGNYVTRSIESGLSDPLYQLISAHPESQYDLLEFRHALEGISVYYAALRGTEADFARITTKFEAIQDPAVSGDSIKEAKVVIEFYLALVEASHNVVLLHLVRGMAKLLEQNILDNLKVIKSHSKDTSKINKQLFQHRKNLFNAVIGGLPEEARNASNEHLAFIEETLLVANRENTRIERALRRIEPKEL